MILPQPWKLFLDDERFPADTDPDWRIARTMQAAKYLIEWNGYPYYMTLDHDLGPDEMTGHDFAKWFVNFIMDDTSGNEWNGHYYVHSQNPVGKANIVNLLDGFKTTWYKGKMQDRS